MLSVGLSHSDPIDLLEEDSKILKESLEYHQSNDAKLVEKIGLLLKAIKDIDNDLLDIAKK